MITKAQYLNFIRDDDRSAFEWIYFRYYSKLLQVAYTKLADEQLAEEVVQDVFVNLWRKRASLDPEGEIYPYLYATLRNRVLHELRTLFNKEKHLSPWQDGIDIAENITPEDKLIASETAENIQAIIDSLPSQCRTAFLLSRQQQLSNKDIAIEMGISVNTVEKHIGKALRIIREQRQNGVLSLALYTLLSINMHQLPN